MSTTNAPEDVLLPRHRLVSAAAGALLTSTLVTPFDVVKTRMQAQKNLVASSSSSNPRPVFRSPVPSSPSSNAMLLHSRYYQFSNGLMDFWCPKCNLIFSIRNPELHYTGPIDALTKIVRNEGFFCLWRGITPALLISIPSTVVYFYLYDTLLADFRKQHVIAAPMLSGIIGRSITTVLVAPLDLIRTKIQAKSFAQIQMDRFNDHMLRSKSQTFDELKRSADLFFKQNSSSSTSSSSPAGRSCWNRGSMSGVIREELHKGGSWLRFWRGAYPTLYRDVPFSAIYWTGYEFLKARLLRSPSLSLSDASADKKQRRILWTSFLSGAFSGMFSAFVTHPFDVVKTRRQIEMYEAEDARAFETPSASSSSPSSPSVRRTWNVLKTIIREEGVRGLFNGLGARMTKVTPSCAIMICTYEAAKAYFLRAQTREPAIMRRG
eukprot:TRINITY_DN3672_c0_g1_i1.p1 TRINITY_DN3672_c0_g1~~TRINITY_DN3672_c0_g1_i1.p1  ORF type:complete len:435 (-),score=77.18 TRINITY_DN3672_c0_g1_i1:216-1520(-)